MKGPLGPISAALGAVLEQTADQWRRSSLLRVGVVVVAALLGLQGFWAWGDGLATVQQDTLEVRAQTEQLRTQLEAAPWDKLAPELQERLLAFEGGLWPGKDPALVQAGLQDWLRASARAAGVPLRELTVTRLQSLGGASSGNSTASPPDLPIVQPAASGRVAASIDVDALEREGLAVWQVRARLEFERASALSFLASVAVHPQWLVISGMQLDLQRSPPTLSLDLRALSRVAPRKP